MGVYYNPDEPAIVPDGFLAIGVKRDTGERGRLSYVLWQEPSLPILALEVISERYNKEYEDKLEDYQSIEILYYAIYNPFSGRRGRFKTRKRLEIYKLVGGKYELLNSENNWIWLPEIELGLGYEVGEYNGWQREWLYWFDRSSNRYLTAEERAEREKLISQQERLAKLHAESIALQATQRANEEYQEKERLAAYLRSIGVNPDDI